MRQFTSEEIQAQFDKLPANVQQAVTSPEIHDKIEAVGKKYGLMIDQLGELVDEIGLVLLGLHRSSDFVDQISRRLNISGKAALTISQDVNREVFDSIKEYLRETEDGIGTPVQESSPEENRVSTVSTLERIGGFEVDKPAIETEQNGVTSADKASILDGLENPQPIAPVMKGPASPHSVSAPANLPSGTPTWSRGQSNAPIQQPKTATSPRPISSAISQSAQRLPQKPVLSPVPAVPKNEQHTEPLVDFLLGNSAAQPAQKIVSQPLPPKQVVPVTPPAPTAPKRSGPDPYREAA